MPTMALPIPKFDELSVIEQLAYAEDDELDKMFKQFSDDEMISFYYNWNNIGRPEQRLPDHDDWRILLLLGGRGSGKTRPSAEIVHTWAENKNWHIALVGETAAENRDVMVEGPSGILATAKPWNPVEYYPSHRRLVWPRTGTWATTYSGDKPDQLRGPNSSAAWCDEIAKFKYLDETWSNLRFMVRAGDKPRTVVSTTPRPIPLIKQLVKDSLGPHPRVILRRYSTYRNRANLSPDFIEEMLEKYEGTRLGRQELHAEILEDTEGALWKLSKIEELRVSYTPHMSVIAVGVDPATSTGGETGIIVMGLSGEDLYMMADYSIQGLPEDWGNAVVKAYHDFEADIVIPEKNQGGDMVSSVIRTIDPLVPIEPVWAARGKETRAQPIATYTERGKVHHIGGFAALEDEMTQWVPNEKDMPSPNRLDAYVWAATHLLKYTPYGIKSKRAFAA